MYIVMPKLQQNHSASMVLVRSYIAYLVSLSDAYTIMGQDKLAADFKGIADGLASACNTAEMAFMAMVNEINSNPFTFVKDLSITTKKEEGE